MSSPETYDPLAFTDHTNSRKAKSANAELHAVINTLNSWNSSPDGSEFFIEAVRNVEFSQGVATELARELIYKLTLRSRRILEADGILKQQSWRDVFRGVIIVAFALVVVGSAVFMGISAIRKTTTSQPEKNTYAEHADHTDHTDNNIALQFLLTAFTASVGFLGGCGLFVSTNSNQIPARRLRQHAVKHRTDKCD